MIRLENITFYYGLRPFLKDVSLEVPDPKAFALTAPAIIRPSGMTNERFKRL